MKHCTLLFLLMIISCKEPELKNEVILKDETLDLNYEVLNQLIKDDSLAPDFNHLMYNLTLSVVSIGTDDSEIKPLGINLKYDSIFLQQDSAYYRNQGKKMSNFKFNKIKINSNVRYITGQELQKLREKKKSDFWTEFGKKYGEKCIRSFSIPFFNKDKTICIVENSVSCGYLNANGYTAMYKKINGKWKVIKSFDHWIS
ncbi:hypothetical protein N0B16_09610 [Chryseobacterium sp. GMJ5]|uniref:Uncharacterized protein n=1 Tax=Chryseobacterium gilvum TaxID=2976534 RepID=A0ABT2W064_9FLAO|nr:hypothetical protein [Chryseobacterium gilvum]MCU7614689.1 hypothetical protein [Chryseobacterium gilvum]